MERVAPQNLITGSIPRKLFFFTWPLVLTNFLQTLHLVTDVLLAGRLLGANAMSAVTIGGQSVVFLSTFSMGLAAGGQILIAQYRGAKKTKEEAQTKQALFVLSTLLGLVLALGGFFLTSFALGLLRTPQEALEGAKIYMRISTLGLVFVFLYNALAATLRGQGKAKEPLILAIIAVGVHIMLALVFVARLDFGIFGLALSALCGQGAAVMVGLILQRKEIFTKASGKKAIVSQKSALLKHGLAILKVGTPFGLQMCLLNLSNLFIIRLINPFGVAASAALGAGSRVTNMLTIPLFGISNGASTMIGQSLGAKEEDRAKKTVFWTLLYTLGFVTITIGLTLLFPARLLGVFTDKTEVIDIGVSYLRILSIAYLGHALHASFNSYALGSGKTLYSLLSAGVEASIGRVALTWAFAGIWGMYGIFTAQSIAPFLAAGISFWYWIRVKKKR